MGVVQVEGWTRFETRVEKGETHGRVEFSGKLLSDHPFVGYSLTDTSVHSTILGFNFVDKDEEVS